MCHSVLHLGVAQFRRLLRNQHALLALLPLATFIGLTCEGYALTDYSEPVPVGESLQHAASYFCCFVAPCLSLQILIYCMKVIAELVPLKTLRRGGHLQSLLESLIAYTLGFGLQNHRF
jgi:hypothetical protein